MSYVYDKMYVIRPILSAYDYPHHNAAMNALHYKQEL